jgi:acetyltransferase
MLAIPAATGILVAEMAPPGLEAFVGAKSDESFGPLVLVGMGGTQAELFGDIAVLPAPTTPNAVAAALDKLKLGQLLKGYRGAPAVDTTALAAVATSLSAMICASSPDLSVDLNPVRLIGREAIVLDAKVSMRPA